MEESPALTTALKAFSILTREQKAVLSRTLEGFVDSLAPATNPNPNASSVATENSWHNRANWSEAEWVAWETWGWYRHFCRMVRPIVHKSAYNVLTQSHSIHRTCGAILQRSALSLSPKLVTRETLLLMLSRRFGILRPAKRREALKMYLSISNV